MKSELLIVFHQYLVNYSPYCVCLEFCKTFLTSLIFTGTVYPGDYFASRAVFSGVNLSMIRFADNFKTEGLSVHRRTNIQ